MIHWKGTPKGMCERKDSKIDQRVIHSGPSTITLTGEAYYPGNVTCGVCLFTVELVGATDDD